MNYFFITGLPRTRTSWFANLFTYKESFCFHELCNYNDMEKELLSRPEKYVGVSDCVIPYYYGEMDLNKKLVIIERNLVDAIDSLFEWMNDYDEDAIINKMKDADNKIKLLQKNYDNLTFSFDELNDVSVIKQIWDYCVPTINFDMQRWEMLDKFRIDPFYDKWKAQLVPQNIMEVV